MNAVVTVNVTKDAQTGLLNAAVTMPADTEFNNFAVAPVKTRFDFTKALAGRALKDGEFKFRANNAWDVSWGTNAAFFGTAVQGGDNIPLGAEWTYDVYFNDATGAYTIIPVE